MPFELIHSEVVHRARAFAVRLDRLRLPDGRSAELDIVEHVDSVLLLPLDEQGNVYLVRQYRHAAGQELLELPAGTLRPGEDSLAAARRELREETGLDADQIREIGGFYLAPGYSTEYMRVYLATGLRPGPLERDADEFLDVVKMPLAELREMARAGRLQDVKTLGGVMLLEGEGNSGS